jgi:hypothetical protein
MGISLKTIAMACLREAEGIAANATAVEEGREGRGIKGQRIDGQPRVIRLHSRRRSHLSSPLPSLSEAKHRLRWNLRTPLPGPSWRTTWMCRACFASA